MLPTLMESVPLDYRNLMVGDIWGQNPMCFKQAPGCAGLIYQTFAISQKPPR